MKSFEWFVYNTWFFFTKSRQYVAGMHHTPADWVRAYKSFMKLSWGDRVR